MNRARKKTFLIVAIIIAIVCVVGVAFVRRDGDKDYEAIIDEAIRAHNPALCEDVRETTRPGPADAPTKITGQEAVNWCKQQVEAGQRIYGG